MSVEVILLAEVKDLGLTGDLVHVSEGYARNYLYARKLAVPVTTASRRRLDKLLKEREELVRKAVAAAREFAVRIEKVQCTIPVKVGEGGKLFGSVSAADIAAALKAQDVEIDRHQIMLAEPLRELGVFETKVKLNPEVEATLKVWIVEE